MEFLYRPPDVGRTILTSLSSTSMQTLRHTQKKIRIPTPIKYGGYKLIKLEEFKYLKKVLFAFPFENSVFLKAPSRVKFSFVISVKK